LGCPIGGWRHIGRSRTGVPRNQRRKPVTLAASQASRVGIVFSQFDGAVCLLQSVLILLLLVERGLTLPSNLQGLNEVRYDGDRLDYEATMKLLKAFNDFRK